MLILSVFLQPKVFSNIQQSERDIPLHLRPEHSCSFEAIVKKNGVVKLNILFLVSIICYSNICVFKGGCVVTDL